MNEIIHLAKMTIEDHIKRIHKIQEECKVLAEQRKTDGNLTYNVFLRSTGAINNHDGTYTIYESDMKAWFENGDHLRKHTEYDKL